MEADRLVVRAEEKLISQADELVVLVDSSKFQRRSSLVLCPLSQVSTIITDDGITDDARNTVEDAGVTLITVSTSDDMSEAG